MLDTLVTLIAFMLFSATFLSVVSMDSPVPVNSAASFRNRADQRPLQLTVSVGSDETTLWSPFDRIRRVAVPHLQEGGPDVLAVHAELVKVKQQFPKERQLVIVPNANTPYDTVVALMDAARLFDPMDPPIYVKDETGVDQAEPQLFPEVVFGNLLGDS
ncbi:MAG: biopolymer transporter ExbD [Bdellovibrionales bacterium]|nr:biopolymer transporter ExbD [Bdellovibrionales bacterium]